MATGDCSSIDLSPAKTGAGSIWPAATAHLPIPDFAAAKTFRAAADDLATAIRALGFVDFNYGCINFADSIISTMPPEWIAHYMAAEFWRSDPLVCEARTRVSPFYVSDVFTAPPVNTAEQEMRTAIAAVPVGVVVPLHCPHVGMAVCSFLTSAADADLRAAGAGLPGMLTVLATRFHDAVRRFYLHGRGTDLKRSLTARERELLTLAAQGKSSAEIAAILTLSTTTVNNHFGRIIRKLDVANRSQAVARAIQIGQIARTQ